MKQKLKKIGLWTLGILGAIVLLISVSLYVFKDSICNYVVEQVSSNLKSKVTVAKVDLAFWGSFPNLSVDFNRVFIQDSYSYSKVTDTLLYSDRIRLKFNPMDLWNEKYDVKEIQISAGSLNLKINKKGENNYDIFKPSSDTTSSNFNLNLENVNCSSFNFAYRNKLTSQAYLTFFEELELEGAFTADQFTLSSKSEMRIKQVKSGQVSLIKNKHASFDISILVDKVKGVFALPKANLLLENLPFKLKGEVNSKNYSFQVSSENLSLVDVAKNFNASAVDNIKELNGSGQVRFNLDIKGQLAVDSKTLIKCDFGVKNGALTDPIKGLKLSEINVGGLYTNEGGDELERLELQDLSFNTPGGPFRGRLLLTNFTAPKYEGSAVGNLNLAVLNNIFKLPSVDSIRGNIDVNSQFQIQANLKEDETFSYNVLRCDGEIKLKNIALKLVDDKRHFSEMNGDLYLRGNEAGIDGVRLKVGKSDLEIQGVFKNIIAYLKEGEDLEADVEIQSTFIDIQDLSTETKEEQIQDGRNFVLPVNIRGIVALNVGKMVYEKHTFSDIVTEMHILERRLSFSKLLIKNAGASIQGVLSIEENTPEIFTIQTKAISTDIEFKPLFKEWDNFDQSVIDASNISGKAQIALDFKAPFDLRSGILKNAIQAKVELRVLDGRLKNVSTFKSITESMKTSAAKLVLSKNNMMSLESKLMDLKFETLQNTIIIQNGWLEIPQMTIETNALSIDLVGKHSFTNEIDYRFAFRWKELKEGNKNTEFGELVDDETGFKVFVRMYGNLDNPTIKWDEEAKKEQAKENRAEAKKDAKSILKSEFGLFKNDSTVQKFESPIKQKETIEFDFGDSKDKEKTEEQKKKDTKISKTIKKWKEQSEKEKKEEIDFN
jgi:hypothetical protein